MTCVVLLTVFELTCDSVDSEIIQVPTKCAEISAVSGQRNPVQCLVSFATTGRHFLTKDRVI